MTASSSFSRRDALRNLANLTAGFTLLSSSALRAIAQTTDQAVDYPVDCTPPTPTGPATPFKGGALTVLPRKSAFALSDQEIASLTLGWQKLREITTSDPANPIGWLRQSYAHCWSCGGGTDGNQGEEIHGSWWFLPWHRCYLYFVERMLAKVANDPNLRLPYWDWSTQSPTTQTFPPIFATAQSSLYDNLRKVKPGDPIPQSYVGPKAMSLVLNAATFALFGGVNPTTNGAGPGKLETIPHNNVHTWTGTSDAAPNWSSDMGVLATAARDPVFFAHHANVDRMWPSWMAIDSSHTNPTDQEWLNHSWTFYDENGVWTSIKVSDVVDPQNLGYVYDSLASTTSSTLGVKKSLAATPSPTPAPQTFFANSVLHRLKDAPVTHHISLLASHKKSFQALSQNGPQQYLLIIENVVISADTSVAAKVYVNYPKATASTTTEISNFVGLISSVAKVRKGTSHHGHHHGGVRFTFVIDAELAARIVQDNAIRVTLVPIDSQAKKSSGSNFTYQQISIEPMQ